MPSVSAPSLLVDVDLLPLPVERYLHDFRGGLLSLPESERDLIITEVRGQIAAQQQFGEGGVAALLEKLGPPARLAERFTLRHELTVGVQRSNPSGLIWTVLKLAAKSVVALVGGMFVAVFFVVGVVAALVPVFRLVAPQSVFFTTGKSFSLTILGNERPPGAETLSWPYAFLLSLFGVFLVVMSLAILRGLGVILLADMRRKTVITQ